MKIRIRFNKTRGQPGRGSLEHVWRVFAEKEYLCKHIELEVPCKGEKEGDDWNIVCDGDLQINRATSTIKVVPVAKKPLQTI
jgi:hypothetical protein